VIGGRWAWLPGSHGARPVYAPALVVWQGGSGWDGGHHGDHGPAVGWFPLGPREVFVPPYRHSTPYLHQVNTPHVPNTRVVDKALADLGNQRYIHQSVPQAVTVAPLRTLGEGRPIAGAMIRPDRNELGRQPITARPPEFPGQTTPRREPAPQPQGLPAPRQEALPANPASAISQAVRPAPQPSRDTAPPAAPVAPRREAAGGPVPHGAPWNTADPAPAVVPPRPAMIPAQPAPMASPPQVANPPQPAPARQQAWPSPGMHPEPSVRFTEPTETVRPRPVPAAPPEPAAHSMPAPMPQRITVPAPAAPAPAPMPMPARDNWRTESRSALEAQPRPMGAPPVPAAPPRDMLRNEAQIKAQGGPGDGPPMRQGGRFMPQ
jgi:hypothetical protein